MVDLAELSEPAHRVAIPGIKQIRVYLISVDLLSFYLGCDRLERVFGWFLRTPRPPVSYLVYIFVDGPGYTSYPTVYFG
ncbi:hypothetical protein [Tropheryma whipplei]|uniref:hypothetical protein n=1 Tax=Tropheryma whipplei TaxID=2039 RepID=UPI0012BAED0A|nr:hypothetical protein [Tropheryma whipplei]